MNLVDIAIIGVFAVSVLIGVFRGFIREALSLTSWVVSVSLAYLFVDVGVMYLEPHISQPLLRLGAAFAAIFIISLLLTSIIGYLLYRLLSIATKIGPGDRLAGAVVWLSARRHYYQPVDSVCDFYGFFRPGVVEAVAAGGLFYAAGGFFHLPDAGRYRDIFQTRIGAAATGRVLCVA